MDDGTIRGKESGKLVSGSIEWQIEYVKILVRWLVLQLMDLLGATAR